MNLSKIISVVIPTFNRKELTDRAIDSVVCTNPDLVEILIVDDKSDTPYQYKKKNNINGIEVSVIRCQENLGPGLARKQGVDAASGKIVSFLDSDDVYDQEWLDSIIEKYSENPRTLNIYAGSVLGSKIINQLTLSFLILIPDNQRLLIARMITVLFNPFYTSSVAMSKELCKFSDSLRYCEDYYTVVSAVFRAEKLLAVKEIGCRLGRHPASKGGISSSMFEMFHGEMQVRRAMLKTNMLSMPYKIMVPLGIGYQFLRASIKVIGRYLNM